MALITPEDTKQPSGGSYNDADEPIVLVDRLTRDAGQRRDCSSSMSNSGHNNDWKPLPQQWDDFRNFLVGEQWEGKAAKPGLVQFTLNKVQPAQQASVMAMLSREHTVEIKPTETGEPKTYFLVGKALAKLANYAEETQQELPAELTTPGYPMSEDEFATIESLFSPTVQQVPGPPEPAGGSTAVPGQPQEVVTAPPVLDRDSDLLVINDMYVARFYNKLTQWLYKQAHGRIKNLKLAAGSYTYGIQPRLIQWDADCGKVLLSNEHPRNVWIDPGATGHEDATYVILAQILPVPEAVAMFPKFKKKIEEYGRNGTTWNVSGSAGGGTNALFNPRVHDGEPTVLIRTAWIRHTKFYMTREQALSENRIHEMPPEAYVSFLQREGVIYEDPAGSEHFEMLGYVEVDGGIVPEIVEDVWTPEDLIPDPSDPRWPMVKVDSRTGELFEMDDDLVDENGNVTVLTDEWGEPTIDPIAADSTDWPIDYEGIRQIQILGYDTVMFDGRCPYRDIPLVWHVWAYDPESPYGISEVKRMRDPQKALNRQFSAFVNTQLQNQTPARVMMEGVAEVLESNMFDEPDVTFTVPQEIAAMAGGLDKVVQFVRPADINQSHLQLYQATGMEFERVSSTPNVMQGVADSNARSGRAIAELKSAAMGPLGMTSLFLERMLQTEATIILGIIDDFMTPREMMQITSIPREHLDVVLDRRKSIEFDVYAKVVSGSGTTVIQEQDKAIIKFQSGLLDRRTANEADPSVDADEVERRFRGDR